jgi:uncharacterized protein
MGYRDTSAQLGSDSGLLGAHARVAKAVTSGAERSACTDARPIARARSRVAWTGAVTARSKSMAAWILLLLVRFYITFLSPFFGGGCRFDPSCSNYAHQAIVRHGARRGVALSVKRLLRCNPFVKGGYDPVPDPVSGALEVPDREQDRPFAPWTHGKRGSAQ